MNKVITINLNGVAYQLEEGGYDALRAYLDNAARRLEENPDKDEIITDIEQAIAEKFRALLGIHKTVVNVKEVSAVIGEMGPVQDDLGDGASTGSAAAAGATANAATEGATAGSGGVRRLFRIYPQGAMVSGVCNGLGAYFGLDPTLFRIGFVLLAFLWGTGFWVYAFMVILVPQARTSAEQAAAAGAATTAQEFIKRAKDGYYEGMKSFRDRGSRRAWKKRFKQDMRAWKYGFQQQFHEKPQHWQCPHGAYPPPMFASAFIAPLLSLVLFALFGLAVYAVYSLVTAHALFGFVLPATMPLWVGIMLVVLAYLLVSWPCKALRWSCYFPGPCGRHPRFLGDLIGSLVGLFFLAFGIWSLDRHVPEFHEWLVQLPGLLHRAVDAVQAWIASKP